MSNTRWEILQEIQLNNIPNLTTLFAYTSGLKSLYPGYEDYRICACGVFETFEGLRNMTGAEIEAENKLKQAEFQQYLKLKDKYG